MKWPQLNFLITKLLLLLVLVNLREKLSALFKIYLWLFLAVKSLLTSTVALLSFMERLMITKSTIKTSRRSFYFRNPMEYIWFISFNLMSPSGLDWLFTILSQWTLNTTKRSLLSLIWLLRNWVKNIKESLNLQLKGSYMMFWVLCSTTWQVSQRLLYLQTLDLLVEQRQLSVVYAPMRVFYTP